MAVECYSTNKECVIMYCTQNGFIHSWDLRMSRETMKLRMPPQLGSITSMAVGKVLSVLFFIISQLILPCRSHFLRIICGC